MGCDLIQQLFPFLPQKALNIFGAFFDDLFNLSVKLLVTSILDFECYPACLSFYFILFFGLFLAIHAVAFFALNK